MENEKSYSPACPPYWDSDVWIIGGGPSARSFDFRLIYRNVANRGEQRVIVVNDACRYMTLMPSVCIKTAIFSLDNRWVRRNREFLSRYKGEKYIALPLETWPDCAGIPGVVYMMWAHADGLCEDPAAINTGGNSGYGAVNLAYLKRAHQIFLIGFDMDPIHGQHYEQWATAFDTTTNQFRNREIKVWNVNPDSHIRAFPKIDLKALGCILDQKMGLSATP